MKSIITICVFALFGCVKPVDTRTPQQIETDKTAEEFKAAAKAMMDAYKARVKTSVCDK